MVVLVCGSVGAGAAGVYVVVDVEYVRIGFLFLDDMI